MSRVPVRMVCHAILRIDLVPAQVCELEATIRRRCRDSDAQLVDFCVDLGTPKRRPEEYPALSPNTEPGHWTRSDVLKLLREARSVQPLLLSDEPRGAPAAW